MKKKLLFWCPFLSDVGTINATLQSMESLQESKKFNCKIMNVYGEFDEYSSLFKKKNIEEIKLLKNRFVKKLPKKGFIWSRLNYILIFILSLFPLFVYLKKNKEEIMFIYLLSSLPLFVINPFISWEKIQSYPGSALSINTILLFKFKSTKFLSINLVFPDIFLDEIKLGLLN